MIIVKKNNICKTAQSWLRSSDRGRETYKRVILGFGGEGGGRTVGVHDTLITQIYSHLKVYNLRWLLFYYYGLAKANLSLPSLKSGTTNRIRKRRRRRTSVEAHEGRHKMADSERVAQNEAVYVRRVALNVRVENEHHLDELGDQVRIANVVSGTRTDDEHLDQVGHARVSQHRRLIPTQTLTVWS